MATCFVIILSVVVFSCSRQSSNTGYSSKGILLQVSSHWCVWRCVIISGWLSGSDQSGLIWTVFIKRQSSSLLCLWFWLKVVLLWSSESSTWFMRRGEEGEGLWKRETERERGGLHLFWTLHLASLSLSSVLCGEVNSEDTVAGCQSDYSRIKHHSVSPLPSHSPPPSPRP